MEIKTKEREKIENDKESEKNKENELLKCFSGKNIYIKK